MNQVLPFVTLQDASGLKKVEISNQCFCKVLLFKFSPNPTNPCNKMNQKINI